MTTQVDLINRALNMLGVTQKIASTSESSAIAEICVDNYDKARLKIFRAVPWPSLRKQINLPLSVTRDTAATWTESDPAPSFKYSYTLPSDNVLPYHLHSFARFSISGNILSTNDTQPILYYTANVTEIDSWEDALLDTVTLALAVEICMPILNRIRVRQTLLEELMQLLEDQRALHLNLQDVSFDFIPDHILARGYRNALYHERFYYPVDSTSYGVTA